MVSAELRGQLNPVKTTDVLQFRRVMSEFTVRDYNELVTARTDRVEIRYQLEFLEEVDDV